MFYINKSEVILTNTHYKIIHLFMENKERITERKDIINQIWGLYDKKMPSNTLTVHINKLRKILDKADAEFKINTFRGIGYKLMRKTI